MKSNFKIFSSIKFRLFSLFFVLLLLSTTTTLVLINSFVRTVTAPPGFKHLEFGTGTIISDNFTDSIEAIPIPEFKSQARTFVISQIENDRNEVQQRIMVASVLMIFAQMLIATAGGYMVIKKVFNPIEQLNNLMHEINEKALDVKIDDEGTTSEIKELILSFNSMVRRLEYAFTSQKQFVENVSHEIKTPLTVIKTNLESVLFDSNSSRKEIESALKTSIDSITFLNKLTEDLLLLSIVDVQNINLEKTNLNECVQKTIDEVKPIAEKNNMSIKLYLPKENIFVNAQNVLLKRAIANVIENAIKYSKENSIISTKVIIENGFVKINIEDNGIGIKDEYKEKIFDRFYRIDKSRSKKTGGTGLGLAITKEVITLFGGKIDIYSKLNQGTTISIILPVNFASK